MYRLHDNLSSGNGYKVWLLLNQLRLPFERIEYNIDSGATRTPDFLENINSNGRIPVLEVQDKEFLPESNAILMYLAEGTNFLPQSRMEQTRVLGWLFFEQYSHEPNIATPRFRATHGVGMDRGKKLSLVTKRRLGYDALGVMERHLEGSEYLVGGWYSVADIALYACTPVAEEGGFGLGGFPALGRWLSAVEGRPDHIPITHNG